MDLGIGKRFRCILQDFEDSSCHEESGTLTRANAVNRADQSLSRLIQKCAVEMNVATFLP